MRAHISITYLCDILGRAAIALTGLVLIRFMPTDEFAKYVILLGVSNLISTSISGSFGGLYILAFNEFGLDNAAGGFVAVELAVILLAGIGIHFCRDFVYDLTPVLLANIVGACMAELSRDMERQKLLFGRFVIGQIVRSVLFFAFVLALAYTHPGRLTASNVLLVQGLSALLVSWPIFFSLTRAHRNIWPIGKSVAKKIISQGHGQLITYFLLSAVISQIDIMMMRSLSSDFEVATFGSAFRYYGLMSLTVTVLHRVILPHLQAAQSVHEMDQKIFSILRWIAPILIVFAAGILIAPYIIPWIDHGKYPEAIPVFQTLAVASVLTLFLSPFVNELLVLKDYKFLLAAAAANLAVGLVFDYWAIRSWQGQGAALNILIVGTAFNLAVFARTRHWRARQTLDKPLALGVSA